jgi:hypothetical protein
MHELRSYLERTLPTQYKPNAELLNLRKTEDVLAKQKKLVSFIFYCCSYQEAKRVMIMVKSLEERE